MQRKTKRPVQFEITEQTRVSLSDWIKKAQLTSTKFLFIAFARNVRLNYGA
jgi:hypothetical protein